ncbi:MAG: peptide chain release factor-like protein [Candidatus Omnitrophica bacterium]|nr:peptide chain release factor-like protein [Candidatus Omnitrophota bacterium]MDD5690136.1 peptide chain release factor-like protein [Candidatus Omnitrophota bacterium]
MVTVTKDMTALEKKMLALGVREEDIVESFIRSSGPGGQNVNKTATCVYLKHLPTGLEVKCQRQRYQLLNRNLARHILLSKIENRFKHDLLQRQSLRAKIMRQTRKKPKRIKLKILEHKRRHSEKKSTRRKIREIEIA